MLKQIVADELRVERRPDGALVLRSREGLAEHPAHLGLVLRGWAEREPGRVFLAERQGDGVRRITYGEAWRMARSLATRMLADGLGPERPVLVLSDNSVDHALVGLGAMLAGVPVAPVSAAYSLLSQDHAKLRTLHAMLRPGWIFTEDGAGYLKALGELPIDPATRVVIGGMDGSAEDARLVDQAFDRIGPDTVAKILFTSGSTGAPKGVINTHRMLCSNQQAMTQGWPFLRERQQTVVDWLPWSHTFGGNHNFNLVLWHGGTLWVDRGKPVPGRIEETVATLRLASPTVYFNVPRGFDALLPAPSSWRSRRRSTPGRSRTRATSISAPCSTAARRSWTLCSRRTAGMRSGFDKPPPRPTSVAVNKEGSECLASRIS